MNVVTKDAVSRPFQVNPPPHCASLSRPDVLALSGLSSGEPNCLIHSSHISYIIHISSVLAEFPCEDRAFARETSKNGYSPFFCSAHLFRRRGTFDDSI